MTPSQALKQKIEADALAHYMAKKPSTRKYKSPHYIQEDYCAGAQSLVPLVESLVEAVIAAKVYIPEDRPPIIDEALTNYRKFIGG